MTITLGTEKTVDTEGVWINFVSLSATTGIAFYAAATDGFQARHLTLSAGVITTGAELTIDGALVPLRIRSAKLTSTSAMVVYDDGSTAEARVITVSGTTLTANAATGLTDTSIDNTDVATLDSTHVIYVFRDTGSGNGVSRILSVSGTTITENAIFTFDATGCYTPSVTALSSSKAVVCFIDSNNSDRPTGEVLDISGTTITGNADAQLGTSAGRQGTGEHSLLTRALDSTDGIVAYGTPSSPFGLLTIVWQESAGSLTSGSTYTIGSTTTATPRVTLAANSATRATTTLGKGASTEISELAISGTVISTSDQDTLPATASSTRFWSDAMDANTTIIVWEESTHAISVSMSATGGRIWLTTDGGSTYNEIGDPAWADVVGGVVVIPGTNYQTIYAQVGNVIYKTTNQGSSWASETTVGYATEFMKLLRDQVTMYVANAASGGNRASLWDGSALTHINTGKSTTGGATSGDNTV